MLIYLDIRIYHYKFCKEKLVYYIHICGLEKWKEERKKERKKKKVSGIWSGDEGKVILFMADIKYIIFLSSQLKQRKGKALRGDQAQ